VCADAVGGLRPGAGGQRRDPREQRRHLIRPALCEREVLLGARAGAAGQRELDVLAGALEAVQRIAGQAAATQPHGPTEQQRKDQDERTDDGERAAQREAAPA
jgi:hypothetical protein